MMKSISTILIPGGRWLVWLLLSLFMVVVMLNWREAGLDMATMYQYDYNQGLPNTSDYKSMRDGAAAWVRTFDIVQMFVLGMLTIAGSVRTEYYLREGEHKGRLFRHIINVAAIAFVLMGLAYLIQYLV